MTEKTQTFCRICEPHCPMLATVDGDGKVVALEPNKDHPLKSTACHKGLSYLGVHQDPDRLDYPIRRKNPRSEAHPDFERVTWDESIGECADQLNAIIKEHGPNAVAIFGGNPAVFNSRVLPYSDAFAQMLGTAMNFNAATQDMTNRMTAGAALYGCEAIMMPDLYNTEYLLCMGANPRVSKWTVVSTANDSGKTLEAIRKRGGKICFVNPRITESSTPETGETLQIKPGADVYFLAAVLNEIKLLGGLNQAAIDQWGSGVDEVFDFVSQYPADRVEHVTGIPADEIKTVAADIIAANGASIYVSVGVNQGGQGLLSAWLADVIVFVTGNLGRKGGMFKPTGFSDMYRPAALYSQEVETSLGALKYTSTGPSTLSAVALPKLIASGDIKALIVIAGNPLQSAVGELEWREAIKGLDLMIAIDLCRNTTAEQADYVFPSTDFLERADISFIGNGSQTIPHIQYTDAMTEPKAERKHDWRILLDLAKKMDIFPGDDPTGWGIIDQILGMTGLSIEKLKALPDHVHFFEPKPYDDLYEKVLLHEDRKVHCFPAEFEEYGLFDRCSTIFDELNAEQEGTLKLVTLRTAYMHNTWLANVKKLRRGAQSINPLHICSEDAKYHNLVEGEAIRVFNQYGSVETFVCIDDDLRSGAVAMAHGYGSGRPTQRVAEANPGANSNQLAPNDMESVEPISNMSRMGAYPVQVESRSTAVG